MSSKETALSLKSPSNRDKVDNYRRHSEEGLAGVGDHRGSQQQRSNDKHLPRSDNQLDRSEGQLVSRSENQTARSSSKLYNHQSPSSKSSCDSFDGSPKKAILAPPSSSLYLMSQLIGSTPSAAEKARFTKLLAGNLPTSSQKEPCRPARMPSNISSLPCTPSGTTTLLDRLPDANNSISNTTTGSHSTRHNDKYSSDVEPLPTRRNYLDSNNALSSTDMNCDGRLLNNSTELNFCSDGYNNKANARVLLPDQQLEWSKQLHDNNGELLLIYYRSY